MIEETMYSQIKNFDLQAEWDKKEWITLDEKFDLLALYKGKAGIYRVILLEKKDVNYIIGDHKLTGTLLQGTVLSIGKSSDLFNRLGTQHFRASHEGNRLGRHLAVLFPEQSSNGTYVPKKKNAVKTEYPYVSKAEVQKLIHHGQICIQFFTEKDWWKRDLFETYGKALHKCLFDLGIEH